MCLADSPEAPTDEILQLQAHQQLKSAIGKLLKGRMSGEAGMPWNDEAMIQALRHLHSLDQGDTSVLCKVGLL